MVKIPELATPVGPGSTIGKIFIEDRHTFVDVPENLVGQVLARGDRYSIRRQNFTVERAR